MPGAIVRALLVVRSALFVVPFTAMTLGAQPFSISGTVFEDVNYGGGPGRARANATGWQAASNGASRATVELYDAAGVFLATTQAAADGSYSFANRAPGSYQVRLVVQTAPSSRSGWVSTLRPVLVFRTDGSSGAAIAAEVNDRVGGENPALGDTTANSGSQTIAQLTSANAQPQALAPVTLTANDVGGVDFGVHFTTVTSTRNSGGGSLAQAITNANTLGGDATLVAAGRAAGVEHVVFMLSNGTTGAGGSLSLAAGGLRSANNYITSSNGTWSLATITPASGAPLPAISTSMVIDAQTQPGWLAANGPVVELSGASVGTNQIGVSLTGGTVTLRGVVVNRFTGASATAISITAGSSHTLAGNWVGVTNAGNAASANQTGLTITNANSVTIGGLTATDRNVVSGNTATGLLVNGTASGTRILGNYVGLGTNGTTRVANGGSGVRVMSATNTAVGDSLTGAGNVIAGNTGVNLYIDAAGTGTTVRGNIIGESATGGAVVNGVENVWVLAPNTVIGGTNAGSRNVIGSAGSSATGLVLQSSGNIVQGNIVGLDPTGTIARGNGAVGVNLFTAAATGNRIGGNVPGARNIISGNAGAGVSIEGAGNIVRGNIIGLTVTNLAGVGNTGGGIIVNNAANNIIGDSVALGRNVIAGNTGATTDGIQITGASTTNTRIWGNYIGVDTTGTATRANGRHGVYVLTSATGAIIGGRNPGMRNIIAGNAGNGIRIEANDAVIRGNFVGIGATNAAVANSGGITINNVANAIIGDSVAAGRNVISGNSDQGIWINAAGATNTRIWGNYIGTDTTGTAARANTNIGIYFQSAASNNIVGGDNPGMRNIISGNTNQGIRLDAGSNIIRGNFIGLNVQNASLPNTSIGVWVNNVANVVIGDSVASGRNIISGNTNQGIQVAGASATNTRIWGNYIGTDSTGTVARANTNIGVLVQTSATSTLIGGNNPGMRNIISGNTNQGIQLSSPSNIVRGNFIGLNAANNALANTSHGVYVLAANNIIGDTLASGRNIISGNINDGVPIQNAGTSGNRVWGNYIGLDSTGTLARPNTRYGVYLLSSASGNTIGGRMPGARNFISGNTNTGVRVEAPNDTIRGNVIGLSVTNQSVANGSLGVFVSNVGGTIIGDTVALGRNVISGNTNDGVAISGSAATGTRVIGNYIGVDTSGTAARPNTRYGVYLLTSASNNTIGDRTLGARNIISGNSQNGVRLESPNNVIRGNIIGLTATNASGVPNGFSGVGIASTTGNLVGDTLLAGRNVISGNAIGGVAITGLTATGNRIWGNFIGTDTTGTAPRGNVASGVSLAGSGSASIGDTLSGAANLITFNGAAGVVVDNTSTGIHIRANRITANSGLGIDLSSTTAPNGVTLNDGAKPSTVGNLGMDFPVLTSASVSGSSLTVSGYVGTAPGQTLFANARADVFVADNDFTGYGQGRDYIGTLIADASGNFSGTLTIPGGVTVTNNVTPFTATATDASGNTSEFGLNRVAGTVAPTGIITGTIFEDLNYGGGAGRSRANATGWQPAVNGSSTPTVELYDASGNPRGSVQAATDGTYSFFGLAAGSYKVRLVTYTTPSSRSGWVNTLRPVLTYRADVSSGTAVAVTDRVGGENPLLPDTLANVGNQTLAQLTSANALPQAVSDVLVGTGTVANVDFGVNFSTVTRTAEAGQGTLRQFITNANALAGQASLAQAGQRSRLGTAEALPAGIETSIFMIPVGAARPGMRASTPSALASGVANITLTSALPTLTRTLVSVDGTTQTVNGGNTNALQLGTGGVVGAENLVAPLIEGPEVQLNGSRSFNGVTLSAASQQVRGLAMRTWSVAIVLNAATQAVLEENVLGTAATTVADPGSNTTRNNMQVQFTGLANAARMENNLLAFGGSSNVMISAAATDVIIRGNEIRNAGVESNLGDNIAGNPACTNWLISGNRLFNSNATSIDFLCTGSTPLTITNNTITSNGASATETVGIALGSGRWIVTKNFIRANRGAGIGIANGVTGVHLSQNQIYQNNSGATAGWSGGISLASSTSNYRQGTTRAVNDGLKPATASNMGMDHPVFTTAAALPSGKVQVAGYVGSAPGQTLFAGAVVEVFTSDNNSSAVGDGMAFLGTVTANATGAFSDSLTIPAGVIIAPGTTRLTGTARDSSDNTSEYGAQALVTGGAATLSISGTVFEDVNYGGGAGRPLSAATGWAAASNGSSRARVELYDGAGTFITAIDASANGSYSFTNLAPGSYQVRLPTLTTPSSRTGWTSALPPVLTFRTDASSGTVVPVTDRVGGESPNSADAAANATALALSAVGTTQAVTPVTLGASAITGVDFGVHFTTVVSTRATGAGSLSQAVTNAEALGGDAVLQTAGRAAWIEHIVFMLANGTTGTGGKLNLTGGLRATQNLFTTAGYAGNVASVATGVSSITTRSPVVIDAQTQPGWTRDPIVDVPGTGFTIRGGNSALRGLILRAGARITIDSMPGNVVQGTWVGLSANGSARGGSASGCQNVQIYTSNNLFGGTTPAERNIVSDADCNGLIVWGGDANVISGNYFGTDVTGTTPILSLGRSIILASGSSNVVFGGSAPGAGNLVAGARVANPSGESYAAMLVIGTGYRVQGNTFGLTADGAATLGGLSHGIAAGGPGVIGGTAPGEGNTIAGVAMAGVWVWRGSVRISGNRIYGNGGPGIDLIGNGVTPNDGAVTPGVANLLTDKPFITTATLLPTGHVRVTGFVGLDPGTPLFGGNRVEVFVADQSAAGFGSGRTYLGTVIAGPFGTFADSLAVPPGVTLRAGSTWLTATATDSLGNTSEFGANRVLGGAVTSALSISGRIFDDLNYSGGPGRAFAEANGARGAANGTRRALVELYDGGGLYLASTSADSAGRYRFDALGAGRYQVRLVMSTTPSARSGYGGLQRSVLTYRTDATSGTAMPVRDRVGGEYPLLASAGANSGSQRLDELQTALAAPQAVAPVQLGSTAIDGVDFGVNFSTVTNTLDAGAGSLRQVLTNANALGDDATLALAGRTAGVEHVVFMISNGTTGGGGKLALAPGGLRATFTAATTTGRTGSVVTIAPLNALPSITSPLVIDAQAQPGWNATAGHPIVELTGSSAGTVTSGVTLNNAPGSAVLGLIVNRWSGIGLSLTNSSSTVIAGSWFGVSATGVTAAANSGYGLTVDVNSASVRIGGVGAANRNVIAANSGGGLGQNGALLTARGNYFGVGADGATVLGNGTFFAIELNGADAVIGGTQPGEGNVLSGATASTRGGLFINANGTRVQGNLIGLDATGTTFVPSNGPGIRVWQGTGIVIGGTEPGAGNIIAGNLTQGINTANASQVMISGNSFFGNGQIGIDLGTNGVNANDGVYTTGQPNNLIDHPVITSASLLPSGKLLVTGYVGTAPGQTVFTDDRVELFVSDNDASGFGEGRTFLGAIRTRLTTSDFSDSLTIPVGITLRPGVTWLTGTTTDAAGNTSEFGANFRFGTGTLAISGTVFEDLNYGGGAGRNRANATGWQPARNGASRARLELYDSTGAYLATTNAVTDGSYSFTELSAGSYHVRLATATTPSSRTGWVSGTHIGVLTYRTDASSGAPVDVTNVVGGANPNRSDAGSNTSAISLAALTTSSVIPQAVAPVTLSGATVTGVDFGVNFSTIVNALGTGQGSLRQFITNANTLGGKTTLAQAGLTPGFETSVFMLPVNGTGYQSATQHWRVALGGSAFPTLTAGRTILDALTQSGAATGDLWGGTPHRLKVEIAAGNAAGFTLAADDAMLRGFIITSATNGISITSGTRVTMRSNYIGVDANGLELSGVGTAINASRAADVEIGGLSAGDGNVLSGSTNSILTASITNLAIRGNFIGTDASGLRLANAAARSRGWNNVDGTTTFREVRRNIFAGNMQAFSWDANDVILPATGQSTWAFAGNYVGVGRDGLTPLPNRLGVGTSLGSTSFPGSGMVIGGTTNVDRNVISSNTAYGVQIVGNSSPVIVRGNYIGVGADGTTALGNGGNGLYIASTAPVDIGGTIAGAGNVIANNTAYGIEVASGSAVRIAGNNIFLNGLIGIDLASDGVTANTGSTNASRPNLGMNSPVLTAVGISASGKLTVAGYVGSAPGQSAFGNARVELFVADDDASGFGEGRRYVGFTTANASGAFADSLDAPAGTTFRAGLTAITATATDASGNTSEFGARLTIAGGTASISGTIFEDVNYGGGAGRPRSAATGWLPAGTSTQRALVELYDNSGAYLATITAGADGSYAFTGLTPGSYQVRLVTGSTPSSRYSGGGISMPVLTYRADASSGTAVPVTDRVGGDVPPAADAGANPGSLSLSALAIGGTAVQAITPVTVSTGAVSGVDFGVSFATVVNTNHAGQGSFRQFVANMNVLGGQSSLAQSGQRMNGGVTQPLPAGIETSVFMIPAGTAAPGLRASVPSALTNGVANITVTSLLPTLTRNAVAIDGTTQTANVGNTNSVMLGSGGTVGVDALPLPQVPGPEVQLNGPPTLDVALLLTGAAQQLRGLAIVGFANGVRTAGATGAIIEQNIVGSSATTVADPGAGIRTASVGVSVRGGSDIVARRNLVAYVGQSGMQVSSSGRNIQFTANEVRNASVASFEDDALNGTNTELFAEGNLLVDAAGLGADLCSAMTGVLRNNTIRRNGLATSTDQVGVRLCLGAIMRVERNVITENWRTGLTVERGGRITISQNSIFNNNRSGVPGITTGITLSLTSAFGLVGGPPLPNDGVRTTGASNVAMDSPVLTTASLSGSTLTVGGYIGTAPNQSTFGGSLVELFVSDNDPSGYGSGAQYIGSVTAAANGPFSGSLTVPAGVTLTSGVTRLTATATDPNGNTSEFGANVTIGALTADIDAVLTGPAAAPIGQPQRYSVVVRNNGPAIADMVVARALIPSIARVVSAGDGVVNGLEISWPVRTRLAIGDSIRADFTLLFPVAGVYPVRAAASTAANDPQPANNSGSAANAQVTTLVGNAADVALDDRSPTTVTAGAPVVLRRKLTNIGPVATAGPVTLIDTLPPTLAFVSGEATLFGAGEASAWRCEAPSTVVICLGSAIAPGDSALLTLTTRMASTMTVSSQRVRSRVIAPSDVNALNDTLTTEIAVVTPPPAPRRADVRVAIVAPPFVAPGAIFTDTVRVSNAGPAIADSVRVTHEVPSSLSLLSVSGDCDALPCTIATIPGGEWRLIVRRWQLLAAATSLEAMRLSARAVSSTDDPTLDNNSSTTDITLDAARVQGLVFDDRNGNGQRDADERGIAGVQVLLLRADTDTLRTITEASGRYAFGGLASGAARVLVVDGTATGGYVRTTTSAPAALTLEARRTIDADAVGFRRQADVIATVAGPDSLRVGTTATFTVQLANRGPARADAIDARVSGLGRLTVTAADGRVRDGVLSWPLLSLASGETRRLAFTALATDTGFVVLNVASRSETFDPDTLNNSGTRTDARRTVTVVRGALLSIASRTTGPFTVGLPAALVRVVRNSGMLPSDSVRLIDSLPAGVRFQQASGDGWRCESSASNAASSAAADVIASVVRCTGPSIAAGDSARVTLGALLDARTLPRVLITSLLLGGGEGAMLASSPDDAPVPLVRDSIAVLSGADLALRVSTSGVLLPGRAVRVMIDVRNVGTGPTTGALTVSDTIADGLRLTMDDATDNGWRCRAEASRLSCTRETSLAAGDSTRLTLSAQLTGTMASAPRLAIRVETPGEQRVENNDASTTLPMIADATLVADVQTTRSTAEVGDVLEFTGTVRAVGASAVPEARLHLMLPPGFAYQAGSLFPEGANETAALRALAAMSRNARATVTLGGAVTGYDPIVNADGTLDVPIGEVAANGSATVRWRVKLVPGALRSAGVVQLRALSDAVTKPSNVATTAVKVQGGAFSDKATIVGKVFVETGTGSRARQRGADEMGVPGVRLMLEDGTSVITDGEGRYSLPGLAPRLHVLRVDPSSLPDGAVLRETGNRNAGRATSRFIDLTNGEFHTANFAIAANERVVAEVVQRRAVRVGMLDRAAGLVMGIPAGAGNGISNGIGNGMGNGVGNSTRGVGTDALGPSTDATAGATAGAELNANVAGAGSMGANGASTHGAQTRRPFLITGLLQGRFDQRLRGTPSTSDGFDAALTTLSRISSDSLWRAGVRSAFYATGDIGARLRLTLSWDTERDRDRTLLRDFTPDVDFMTYGDASVREFDARTAGRSFARLDIGASTVLAGDFTTAASDNLRQLSAYARTLTGVRQHLAFGDSSVQFTLDGFASRTASRQRVEELRGEGLSGPYRLGTSSVRVNSEQVELVVRDRNQPAVVLSRTRLTRFVDYTLDRDAATLLFRAPVPSVDAALNAVSVRVVYESEQTGTPMWTYGGDGRVRVGVLTLGASAVREEQLATHRDLVGVFGALQLGSRTTLSVEGARSLRPSGATLLSAANTNAGTSMRDSAGGTGDAARVELRHSSARLSFTASGVTTSANFVNPTAPTPAGRTELSGNAALQLTSSTRLLAQALRTEDNITGGRRDGALLSLEQQLWRRIRLELGVRQAETHGTQRDTAVAAPARTLDADKLSALRTRLSVDLLSGARLRSTLAGEFEQDLKLRDQQRAAITGDFGMARGPRLYARHEFLKSSGGPYGLGTAQGQASSVLGITADLRSQQQLFNEYRLKDGMSGRQAEAAIGLRNRFRLDSGIVANTSIERVTGLGATTLKPTMALTGALELTRWESWRGTARSEWRQTAQGTSWLGSAGYLQQLAPGVTTLLRGIYTKSSTQQERLAGQAGLAIRPIDSDRWNAIARLDWRRDDAATTTSGVSARSAALTGSLQSAWQLGSRRALTSRYAVKRGSDALAKNGARQTTTTVNQLFASRVLVDLTRRWDFGLTGSVLGDARLGQRQYGAGAQLGRVLMTNLRIAGGYNLFGWRDADLAGATPSAKGWYVEFGVKVDELISLRR
jgi:uncharacterized repeat protein (TIGR01451 family)